ncbi:MAG TPA: hypothetical protein VNN72_28325, partial [Polyangiaceae bacterium]|nr:hypothetical protein [Polyangiaceae bacterium]
MADGKTLDEHVGGTAALDGEGDQGLEVAAFVAAFGVEAGAARQAVAGDFEEADGKVRGGFGADARA